uniref:Uncharacterized protein n=1 Tax=Romanomermis culicivorax TaxID=13658 RepID=A0A915JF09_ROMCU
MLLLTQLRWIKLLQEFNHCSNKQYILRIKMQVCLLYASMSMIALDPKQARPVNPIPDAAGPPLSNVKQSRPKVELAGSKWDVITPEIRPDLNNLNP